MAILSNMSDVTIKETRHLVLPLATVVDAVVQADRRNHGPLARGEVLQAEFVRDLTEGDGLDVAVRNEDHTIEWRHVDLDSLSRAVIAYCRNQKIPLPFKGEKSLEITRQGLALSIENTVNVSRRPVVEADIAGRPLRYARGYEPHAIVPNSSSDIAV